MIAKQKFLILKEILSFEKNVESHFGMKKNIERNIVQKNK